ncbi:MAG: uroporphyrinogen decarboxylase [Rhodospirillaceae bacterium]|nr:uroporphyrinogen decarboxylase [Rhodospirillaceae bacterium]
MDTNNRPLLAALRGEVQHPPPLWLMRQAGRYLPEYRALRAKAGSFLDLCYDPALAVEATLQPVRRFPLDGIILFSDILVVAQALGVKLWFEEGEGPRLEPILEGGPLPEFEAGRQRHHLAPVYEAMERVAASAPAGATVLGFAGAPWTLATYMVGGGRSRDFVTVKGWAYRDPESFGRLIETLRQAVSAHLVAQLDAGADAVQVFDSWAGALPESELGRWCIEPLKEIVAEVKAAHPAAPVIGYPRGVGVLCERFAAETGVDAVSIDSTVPPAWAAAHLQPHCTVQGNLDPVALVAGGDALRRSANAILEALGDGPFVFNLGEGVLPRTPPEHVAELVDLVKAWPDGIER